MNLDGAPVVQDIVPGHYLSEYPKFITFMEIYFRYMYGKMTPAELEYRLTDATWWKGNKTPPTEGTDEYYEFIMALTNLKEQKRPGEAARRLQKDLLLVREKEEARDRSNTPLVDKDGKPIMLFANQSKETDVWVDNMGLEYNTYDKGQIGFGQADTRRVIKLMRHFHRLRGSNHLMRLFFGIFFGMENVTVDYPRSRISTLDNNFVPDGNNNLRDDRKYSEFSYVIQVKRTATNKVTEQEKDTVAWLYKKLFHPAGFEAFFEITT